MARKGRERGGQNKSRREGGREKQNQYLFGVHAVQAAMQRQPDKVKQLFIQRGRSDQRVDQLVSAARQMGVSIQVADKDKLDEWSEGLVHQGVVAFYTGGNLWSENDLDEILEAAEKPLLLVLDGVTDPHNLGACLRSANGAGVDVVIAPKDKSVGLTPVVRKVACGAAEETPFIQVTNLSRALKELQDKGVWVIGLADEEDGALYSAQLNRPVALVMGAEGKGLRRLTRENCDEIVAIPMAGGVSSLNVSVATGVCLYEAVRQRQL